MYDLYRAILHIYIYTRINIKLYAIIINYYNVQHHGACLDLSTGRQLIKLCMHVDQDTHIQDDLPAKCFILSNSV